MTQGKGSSRRPHDVPTDTVADNWARTFGVTQAQEDVTPPPPDVTQKPVEPVVYQTSSGMWVIGSPTLIWHYLSEPDV